MGRLSRSFYLLAMAMAAAGFLFVVFRGLVGLPMFGPQAGYGSSSGMSVWEVISRPEAVAYYLALGWGATTLALGIRVKNRIVKFALLALGAMIFFVAGTQYFVSGMIPSAVLYLALLAAVCFVTYFAREALDAIIVRPKKRYLLASSLVFFLAFCLYLARSDSYEELYAEDLDGPRLMAVPCWFESNLERGLSCHYLYVREHPEEGSGALIRLPLVIAHGTSPTPKAPIVFIPGGPGGSVFVEKDVTADVVGFWLENMPWSAGHDVIFVEQRGVGLAAPSLACPEASKRIYWASGADAWRSRLLACKDKFAQQGIDLTAYSTQETVADLATLQAQLGDEPWILFGQSYGTRVAMEFLHLYPDKVASAILAGVFPHWAMSGESQYRLNNQIMVSIFESCERQPDCAAKYPNLADRFYSTLERLDQAPVSVQVAGDSTLARLDGQEFLNLIIERLNEPNGYRGIPNLIYNVSEGHYGALAYLLGYWIYEEEPNFTTGAFWAISCNDFPDLDEQLLAAQAVALPAFAPVIWRDRMDSSCDGWTHKDQAALSPDRESHRTNAEVLLLAGFYDMLTPPAWAEETAALMPNAQLFVLPVGHYIVEDPCAQQVIAAFLKSPEAAEGMSCPFPPPSQEFY